MRKQLWRKSDGRHEKRGPSSRARTTILILRVLLPVAAVVVVHASQRTRPRSDACRCCLSLQPVGGVDIDCPPRAGSAEFIAYAYGASSRRVFGSVVLPTDLGFLDDGSFTLPAVPTHGYASLIMEEENVCQDLLPLPTGPSLREALFGQSTAVSISRKRRMRRSAKAVRWLEDGITALNSLADVRFDEIRPVKISQAQLSAVHRLFSRYRECADQDSGLDPQRAWQELLRIRGGYASNYGSAIAGKVSTFRSGGVKLPSKGAGLVDLVDSLLESIAACLKSGHGILRSDSSQIRCDEPVAMDAIFRRSGPSYGSFLGELASVGIAEPCNGEPMATSGLFFLARKDDYLRMIVDPRNANKLCHTPPRTRLPTAAAFSALEVRAGLRLFLSQSCGSLPLSFVIAWLVPTLVCAARGAAATLASGSAGIVSRVLS